MLGLIGVKDGGVAPGGEGVAVIFDEAGGVAEENRGAVGVDPDGHEGFGLFFGGVLGAGELAGFGDEDEGDGEVPGVGVLEAFAVFDGVAEGLEFGDFAAGFFFDLAAGGVGDTFILVNFTTRELDVVEF